MEVRFCNVDGETCENDVKSDKKLLQFKNCQILRDHAVITEDFWVRNGKIVDPEKVFFDEKISADVEIDCKGALIAPGFIDLQINGKEYKSGVLLIILQGM
jgi:N-acetylglucosamine-6-phosphate deacetylase